jgi:hypothetical protein
VDAVKKNLAVTELSRHLQCNNIIIINESTKGKEERKNMRNYNRMLNEIFEECRYEIMKGKGIRHFSSMFSPCLYISFTHNM